MKDIVIQVFVIIREFLYSGCINFLTVIRLNCDPKLLLFCNAYILCILYLIKNTTALTRSRLLDNNRDQF